jgi:hypothetical protein
MKLETVKLLRNELPPPPSNYASWLDQAIAHLGAHVGDNAAKAAQNELALLEECASCWLRLCRDVREINQEQS